MSDLRVPNRDDDFTRMRKDVDDLLRRAPSLRAAETVEGCCGTFCCLDSSGHTVTIGSIQDTCVFEPDPVGGTGVRLKLSGWLRVAAASAGTFAVVIWSDIDGTAYDGAPKEVHGTVASGDEWTIPLGGTYDVDVPDPVLTVRLQNLGGIDVVIHQVYAELEVLPREGDDACGNAHAGTGPL